MIVMNSGSQLSEMTTISHFNFICICSCVLWTQQQVGVAAARSCAPDSDKGTARPGWEERSSRGEGKTTKGCTTVMVKLGRKQLVWKLGWLQSNMFSQRVHMVQALERRNRRSLATPVNCSESCPNIHPWYFDVIQLADVTLTAEGAYRLWNTSQNVNLVFFQLLGCTNQLHHHNICLYTS